MKKRWTVLLCAILIVSLLVSCGQKSQTDGNTDEAVLTKLTVTKEKTAYKIGDAIDLSDTVTVKTFSNGSESAQIAYDDLAANGLAAALCYDGERFEENVFSRGGTYTLTVYDETNTSVYTSIEIAATETGEVYPTGVSITRRLSLVTGDSAQVKITFEPSMTTVRNVTWSSSDPSVASVGESGLITAVSEGNAVITATAQAENGTVESTCEVTVSRAMTASQTASDQTGTFVLSTKNGAYTQSGSVYTVTAAGEYDLSGSLNGRIVISAGDNDEITLHLNGVTIISDQNAAIYALTADSVKIKVGEGTENTVYDKRAAKTEDAADQGEGAVSAKCDLKISGEGKLYVEGNYNNGLHTTKDMKIAEVDLTVKAVNNAIKGKDSVSIESGTITAISTSGDGVKTENTDVSSKGNQRGSITVNGGKTTVYAAGDGVQAAYDFTMNGGELTVYTASNSSYTAKNASVTSYKGIKVQNCLTVNDGTLLLYSYDDALHADYGTVFESGATGLGTITINGGAVTTKVNASTSRYVSGADAIHADNTLNIKGGTIRVTSAYEGLEANFINISGGDLVINASDDGMNAARKIGKTPAITVSGGKTDITMGSGDTDGIDSNGSFTMTGGIVIVRGAPNSNSSMATGLDCDGAAKLTGGTFVQLGARETVPTLSSNCCTLNYGSSGGTGGMGGPGGFGGRGGFGGFGGFGGSSTGTNPISGGTWTVSGTNVSFAVENGYTYYGAVVYSDALTKGATYTISNGSTSYSASAE